MRFEFVFEEDRGKRCGSFFVVLFPFHVVK